MFARNISLLLKPNTLPMFPKRLEDQALPMLGKQVDFLDAIVLENERAHVTAISLWNSRQHADAYEKSTYQRAVKSLETILDGRARCVGTVVHSTSHQLAGVTARSHPSEDRSRHTCSCPAGGKEILCHITYKRARSWFNNRQACGRWELKARLTRELGSR